MKSEIQLLKEANNILRSVNSIIERRGETTNWEGIYKKVKMALAEQHELLLAKNCYIMEEISINHENGNDAKRVLRAAVIRNDQYHNFILSQILRPLQGMLGFEKTIEDVRYKPFGKNATTVNYFELQNWAWEEDKKEWFNQVIDRLSRCIKSCDYSFFPQDDFFANTLKRRMIEAGIEDASPYGSR